MILTGKLRQQFFFMYPLDTKDSNALKSVLEIPTVFQMDSLKKGLYWRLDSDPREVNSKCFIEQGDTASSGCTKGVSFEVKIVPG